MRTAESTILDAALDIDVLQAVLREYPVRLAILFGSHATETTHATSDIDLAVEFDEYRPADPSYNDVFLGLSADLSDALETDDVDLVDLHAVSPALAAAIFENGVLLVGEAEHAAELRRQLTAHKSDQQSPRDRFDAALDRIGAHLDESDTGDSATDSSQAVDDDVRRLYEHYQAAETDEQRREIALEMGKLDRRHHADIYAALEDE